MSRSIVRTGKGSSLRLPGVGVWAKRHSRARERSARLNRAVIEAMENRLLLSVTILNGGGSGYTGLGGDNPPDTCGAAGPTSYIEVINGAIEIFKNKLSGTPTVTGSLDTFLYSTGGLTMQPTRDGSDSSMVYDNLMGRFIIGDLDADDKGNTSNYNIGVSKTSNPTTLSAADWNFYQINTTEGSNWTDYEGNLGFNADALVLTFNLAHGTGLTGNTEIVSINANDLANGVASPAIFHNDISGSNKYRPVTMHDSVAGDPMWLVRNPDDGSHVQVIRMTNVLSSSAAFATTSLSLPAAANFSSGDITPLNKDGTAMSDIDTRILKAGEFSNTIVAAHKIKISGNEADVQWYSINVGGGTPALADVGRIGFGGDTYCYDPAIDINSQGEIGLCYMESDKNGGSADATTTGFVSTFVTARKPADAAGTMQPSVLVPAGTGTGNIGTGKNRIGDFSGINVDPVNGTFWADNEFGDGDGGGIDIVNFTPEEAPTLTAPSDQTAVEGASTPFNLGSFSDSDGSPWTVRVNWGDGTADTVFATSSSGSLGTKPHTYAEEGSDVVKVTVTDSTGQSDSKSFNVSVSDPSVVGTGGFVVTDVEGSDSGVQTVATFTDPGGPEALSGYSAIIDWGDGSVPTVGAITLAGSTFSVTGNHTYAEESAADHAGSNPYAITITLSHDSTADVVVGSTAVVSDPAVTPTGGFTFTAVEGTPSATQTVATFTDPGGPEALSDYSALIDWGDGTAPTAGTISFAAGVYTVTGSHTYATGLGLPGDFGNTFCGAVPPSYHKVIKVSISHEVAPVAVAISDAKISLPPASAHLAGGSLIVVGTIGNDLLVINPVGYTGAVNVLLNSVSLGNFTLGSGGRIVVATIAGNDDIQIASGVRLNTVLYGGPGDDRLKGGGGHNIQVGCEGNDQITGGFSGDLLIGGQGADRIIGGAANDVMVGGELLDAANNEDDQYNDLVSVLNAGLIISPLHASNDNAADKMTGSSGYNIFYGSFSGSGVLDTVTGRTGVLYNV